MSVTRPPPGFPRRAQWVVVVVLLAAFGGGCTGLRIPRLVTLHDPLSADEHLALGIAYEREGKRTLARTEYEAVLRTRPESITALVNLGNLAVADGAPRDAESWYRRAIRGGGKSAAPAANNLAWLYVTQNRRLRPAAALAKKAIAWDAQPAYYDTWVAALIAAGKPLDAAAAIDEAESRWADDVRRRDATAELLAQRTRELAQLAHAQGKASMANGHIDAASVLLREAAKRNPAHAADYLATLAEGLIASARVEEAVQVIEHSAVPAPQASRFAEKKRALAEAAHTEGKTLLRDGRLDSAEALVRGAVRWDPERTPYYLETLAQVLIAQDKPYEAGETIDQAEALAPVADASLRASLYDRKAELYTVRGLTAEARAAARQADALRQAAP